MKQPSKRSGQQTLRTTPVPHDIRLWLDAVNGIPTDQIAPDHANGIPPLLAAPYADIPALWVARINGTVPLRDQKILELRERTRDWGTTAVGHIFREDTDPQEPGERLHELVSAWMTFAQLASFGAAALCGQTVTIGCPTGAGARLISNQGTLHVEISPFLKMLEGIETFRIRECPICRKFFWAGRRDKSACREECARVVRQRNIRARQKANRTYKNKLAKRRSQGSGQHT